MEQPGQVVYVSDNLLVCEERTLESRKINFCPMCGRELDNGKKQHQVNDKRSEKVKAKNSKPKTNYIDEVLTKYGRKA